MVYWTAQVRALEGRKSGLPHPRGVTEPINKSRPVLRGKSPACHGVVVSPQPSLTDISQNRGADEDAASPSALLLRHDG